MRVPEPGHKCLIRAGLAWGHQESAGLHIALWHVSPILQCPPRPGVHTTKERGGGTPGFPISSAGCRKVNLHGLGGGRSGQGSSTGESAYTLCSRGQGQSGIPLLVCSDMCKGNGLSNPRANSRTESWRGGESGCVRAVLGL